MTDKCFYCKENNASTEHAYSHKMHFVHKRMQLWPGYHYVEKKIEIPRCKECYDKHTGFAPLFTYSGLLIFLGGWLWLFRDMASDSLWAYILGVLMMAALTYGLVYAVYRGLFFSKRSGIPDVEEFDEYPLAAQLIKNGWVKSRPDPASHPSTGYETAADKQESEQNTE